MHSNDQSCMSKLYAITCFTQVLLCALHFFSQIHSAISNSAIKYGNKVIGTKYVLLGQGKISLVDSVKHLGHLQVSVLSNIF